MKREYGHYLPGLELSRLGEETSAGLWITSLPVPRDADAPLSLAGKSTFGIPIGQWPGEPDGKPRRVLLYADGGNAAPQTLTITQQSSNDSDSAPDFGAQMELFERSPHAEYIWERHCLRLSHGANSVELALGLKTGDDVHWWEACRLVVKQKTNQCLIVEMGGAIPHTQMSFDEFKSYPGLSNPFLHKHNWLNGQITARLHANGVCEIFAHHINSKFFDDGLDLKNAVPVLGIRCDAGEEEIQVLCGEWNGTREGLTFGNARFDFSEVARLATPEQPGTLSVHDGFAVLQPYQGMELFGGTCPAQLINDSFIYHAEDQVIPRGMARTLRFSLSLSDRSPRIARYLAPAWWYGVCEEFMPAPLLPVSNVYDEITEAGSRWILEHMVHGGFEDGSVPRHTQKAAEQEMTARCEPGWEGEIPYAMLLRAWRTGDANEYSAALRSAYYFTDVCVDHAAKSVRMHGYPPVAFSVPMNRMQASISAYLETGDEYLLDAAQAVTANSYWIHKNSWPRLAVGRDACFIRSAVLLYRYCADDFFRKIAHEAATHVAHSQRENGSFGDQGGGAGIHQWGGYITKPWMGLLALNGVLDYLELFPDEPQLLESVRRFADWLMDERFDHNGVMGWSYQHDFDGERTYFNPFNGVRSDLPGKLTWHQDNLGRLLTFCALRFGKPEYFEAWSQSRMGKAERGDHSVSASLQFVPWVQARLWQATLGDEGIEVHPTDLGTHTPQSATIFTPNGPKEVTHSGIKANQASETR